MTTYDEETWLVQLGDGAVRAMSLDQLDEAFQNGTIDESTLVRRDGASKWVRLSDELEAPVPEPPQHSVSTRPVIADVSSDDVHLELEDALRSARRRRWFVGSVLATAVVGALAAMTAVNIVRMRPRAPVVAEVSMAHVSAPSDPEPKDITTTDTKDKSRPQHRRSHAPPTAAPTDKPAASISHGGDRYDPLNGDLP